MSVFKFTSLATSLLKYFPELTEFNEKAVS